MKAIRYAGPAIVMLMLWLWATGAQSSCGNRFTPIHLVKMAEMILVVDMKQGASKDEYVLTTREVLKQGKSEKKVIKLDLSKARDEQSAAALRTLVAKGKPVLLFMGEFQGDGGGAEIRVLLHMEGQWASCVVTPEGQWLYDNLDQGFQTVWNGGTDMLRRVVEYALRDDDAYIPRSVGVQWSPNPEKIASLDGAIRAVRPVDLAGDGELLLFVARDKGDRLLACEKGTRKMRDVTSGHGLKSTSVTYAWGDFSGQRRLDLVSFDGKALTLHAQQDDGWFKVSPLDLGKAIEHGCLSLAALDVGDKDRAGLLVGGNALPVLLKLNAAEKAAGTALTAPGMDWAKLGKAGVSLVADFDSDGIADVLALRELGSILFRGQAPGQFQPGSACAVRCGDALKGVCVGDYDGDGNLDVLVAGGTTRLMWVNDGKGAFTERFSATGELMSHDQIVRGTDCSIGDVNNDGRQDVLLAYANASPVTYFSRGFLSFHHSHEIDIKENNLLPNANHAQDGAQSACLADVDGDGAQDLVLALASGELWVFFRENADDAAFMVVASLPSGAASKGPLAVTGWIEKRCLGAWNVSPGASQACFGQLEFGPLTLKWRLPGGQAQTREVLVEKGGTLRFELK